SFADSTRLTAVVRPGARYRFASVRAGNLSPAVASRLGIGEKLFLGKPLRYRELAGAIARIVAWYENHGYPFVSVQLDSVRVDGEAFSASFNVQQNRFYRVDSVVVVGDARLNRKFLHRYLGIRPRDPYNEKAVTAVSARIRQLPFVAEKRPPESRFSSQS